MIDTVNSQIVAFFASVAGRTRSDMVRETCFIPNAFCSPVNAKSKHPLTFLTISNKYISTARIPSVQLSCHAHQSHFNRNTGYIHLDIFSIHVKGIVQVIGSGFVWGAYHWSVYYLQ